MTLQPNCATITTDRRSLATSEPLFGVTALGLAASHPYLWQVKITFTLSHLLIQWSHLKTCLSDAALFHIPLFTLSLEKCDWLSKKGVRIQPIKTVLCFAVLFRKILGSWSRIQNLYIVKN